MGLLAALVIGAAVGWLASMIMGRSEGLLGSIVIGVIGSFIGSFLSMVLTGSDLASLTFTWTGVIWSLIGAVILVALLNMFVGRKPAGA